MCKSRYLHNILKQSTIIIFYFYSSRSTHQLIDNSVKSAEENTTSHDSDIIHNLEENSSISIIPKSSTFSNHTIERTLIYNNEDKNKDSIESQAGFNWNQLSADLSNKSNEDPKEGEQRTENDGDTIIENTGSILQTFLLEQQRRNPNEVVLSNSLSAVETEYVSLEKLAETVNTCRICNEKFKDIAHLDEHRNKAGHFQCNIPECNNLVFHSTREVLMHRMQIHGIPPLSPNVNQSSSHLNPNSPHVNQNSPHLSQSSPQMSTHSPHASSIGSPTSNSQQPNRNSPLTSPHQTNSPTYNTNQQMVAPVSFEQLPPPVQQLAQQVQRMPLPQSQMPPSLPPGASTMIPGSNYFVQPPGRPPLYRVPGPQTMHYPPHLTHLYPQYGPGPYPQMAAPPQMHSQLSQQLPRGRYSTVVQNNR